MKNTEQRLREHLEASTSSVRAPDRLDEIMERGHRRQVTTRLTTVLAAAAALAAVIGVGSILTQNSELEPPVADSAFAPDETPTTSPTTAPTVDTAVAPLSPAGSPLGMIVAGPDGVGVYSNGDQEPTLILSSDEGAGSAFPDQRGGLVFQSSNRSASWPPGSIVRQSAAGAEVVASPVAGGSLIPVGPAVSVGDHAAFVYLSDVPVGDNFETRVMMADLDTGDSRQIRVLPDDSDLRVGGDVLASVDRSGDCPTLVLSRLDGTEIASPVAECLPLAAGVAVSGDGESLGVLSNGALRIISIADGTERRRVEVGDSFMVTAGTGTGWLVRAPNETILIGPDDTTRFGPVGNQASAVPFARPIEIPAQSPTSTAPKAGLCQPVDSTLALQHLPEPVAETRQAIFEVSSSCDFTALASLAESDGTVVSVGGGGVDPAAFWRAEAENGNRPLEVMALLLSTTPAQQAETGTWAWPGIHADPSFERSWAELEPILGAEAIAEMRDFGGYLGLRIGITEDGIWQFATAGD